MKYQLVNKNQIFIQNNGDEAKFLLFKENGSRFLINKNAEKILNYILEYNDTDNVLEKMIKHYPDIQIEILEQDIQNIISLLAIYNIIIEDIKYKKNSDVCGVLSQDEYQIASDMIQDNLKLSELNIGRDRKYYSAINIRANIMNNSEYYFIYRDNINCSKIDTVMSVIPNFETSTLVISTLVFQSQMQEKVAKEILKKLIEYAVDIMVNPVNKVRIIFSEKEENKNNKFLQLLLDTGFKCETVLEKEIGDMNTYFYSIKYV